MQRDILEEKMLLQLALDQCDCVENIDFIERLLVTYQRHLNCISCIWIGESDAPTISTQLQPEKALPLDQLRKISAKGFSSDVQPYIYQVIDDIHWYIFPVSTTETLSLGRLKPMESGSAEKLVPIISQLIKLRFHKYKDDQYSLFVEILNQTPYAIQVADENGRLVFINTLASERLGIQQDQASNYFVKDFESIFKGDGQWETHVQDLKKEGSIILEGINLNGLTGYTFPVEVIAKHFKIGQKGYIIASSKDISERKKAIDTIQMQVRLQNLLIKISSTYINIPLNQIKEAIQQSLQEMGEFVNADRAYIFSYDFNNLTTSNTYEWCAEGISPEIDNLQETPMELFPEWLECHRRGEPFHHADISKLTEEKDQGIRAILEPQGIKSILAIPMKAGDELLGFVGFDSVRQHHVYSETEMKLLFVFAQMLINVSRREKWESQLTLQEERYRNIIRNMDMGVLEVDLQGHLNFVNQRYCQMSGYNETELNNISISSLNLSNEYAEFLSGILKKGENASRTKEVSVKNKNGKLQWWFISHSEQYNDKGEVIGSIIEHLDITERKIMQNKLAKAQAVAVQAAKSKEIFLANMSHEIRTPLTTIIGMIRILQKENLRVDLMNNIKKAATTAEHLLAILNNTIDISKIEDAALELKPQPFDLVNLCKDIHGVFSVIAEEKQLPLKISIDPDIQRVLIGDEIRIRQILFNLISNAVKFTEKGFVRLSADVLETTAAFQKINIEIKDTGIGMSEAFVKRVFDKYAQEIDGQAPRYNSAGLGMFIAHDLVKLMGSDLIISSVKGHGTTVSFELTLQHSSEALTVNKRSLSSGMLDDLRVLLVEDETTNRFLMARTLSNAGAIVVEAENGKEAVEILQLQAFDLILMDIQMPIMDGLSATEHIRKKLKSKTPIVAFTANVFKQDIDKYLHSGMNDYLKKPYNDEDILKVIEVNVPKFRAAHTVDTPIEKSSDDNSPNLKKLRSISEGDIIFFNKILNSLIDLFSSSAEKTSDALKQDDIKTIKMLAHKIKPNAELLFAHDLSGLISSMESIQQDTVYASGFDALAIQFQKQLLNITKMLQEGFQTSNENETQLNK
jgi:PAS domain S-box-containing protein